MNGYDMEMTFSYMYHVNMTNWPGINVMKHPSVMGVVLARLHFSAEELLLYPRRPCPRRRPRRCRRPHAKW